MPTFFHFTAIYWTVYRQIKIIFFRIQGYCTLDTVMTRLIQDFFLRLLHKNWLPNTCHTTNADKTHSLNSTQLKSIPGVFPLALNYIRYFRPFILSWKAPELHPFLWTPCQHRFASIQWSCVCALNVQLNNWRRTFPRDFYDLIYAKLKRIHLTRLK